MPGRTYQDPILLGFLNDDGVTTTPISSTNPLPGAGGGGGGGGGDASAANQTTEIARLTSLVANTTGLATASAQSTTNTSLATLIAIPATLSTGQLTLSNSTATQLTAISTPVVNPVTIKALSTNTGTFYVGLTGVTTSTGFPLEPGASIPLQIDNLNKIFIIGTSGQVASWLGN